MRTGEHPLVRLLRRPRADTLTSADDWRGCLAASHPLKLSGRLLAELEDRGELHKAPPSVQSYFEHLRPRLDHQHHLLRCEIDHVRKALGPQRIPVILLKGAAYVGAGYRLGYGRFSDDADILVPKDTLATAERALSARGWQVDKEDPRHERYFREWLHELPPMVHRIRNTTLDVHHNILPPTDPVALDVGRLWQDAREVGANLYVLSPPDMLIHAAVHLFRNGDFRWGLRDLYDIHLLASAFSSQVPDFWRRLSGRAELLGLSQAVAPALRFTQRLYGTQIPARESAWMRTARPRGLGWLLDALLVSALAVPPAFRDDRLRKAAIEILAYWPIPRLRVITTRLFWEKRLPPPRAV